MKCAAKQYAPVGAFEKAAGICPLYIAWIITDELQHYFRVTLPDNICDQIADRAECILAHNTYWRRKFKGRRGRAYLLAFMRHWLTALLRKKHPSLFEQLPDSYQMGCPLPLQACSPPKAK